MGRGERLRGVGRETGREGDLHSQMLGNIPFSPLQTALGGMFHHPHFTDKETEAGRGRLNFPSDKVWIQT